MLKDWALRLRSLFRRRAVECDLEDEMRFHIERQVTAYTRAGLSLEEAVRRARLEFGTFDQVREEHRDARGIGLIEDVARDLRYAMRQIRRAPGFSATVILCLTLGIGATTTVYSVVNAILIRPLPFPESDRLVRIAEYARSDARDQSVLPVAIPYRDFINWRGQTRTLSDLFAQNRR
jgi:putative ABC transport system permease protein